MQPLVPLVPSILDFYTCFIVGERERANLVVQLARFFYIYVYPGAAHTVMFYVLLNMRALVAARL